MMQDNLIQYIYGIADNTLILGQRLGELCGNGPSLETDIAMTNISLDLLGQTRSYYQYAAELASEDITEDDIAFLRNENQYRKVQDKCHRKKTSWIWYCRVGHPHTSGSHRVPIQ